MTVVQLSYPGVAVVAGVILPEGGAALGPGGASYMWPNVMANGDQIGASATPWQTNSACSLLNRIYSVQYGQWGGQSGFMGVRFRSDGGATTHYGWVELEVAADASQAIVKGYAYETVADAPIAAGDKGPASVQGPNAGLALTLYPNPTTDQLFVTGPNGTVDLKVISLTGQVLQAEQAVLGDGTDRATVEVGALSAGAYILEVRQGDRTERREFIKQ